MAFFTVVLLLVGFFSSVFSILVCPVHIPFIDALGRDTGMCPCFVFPCARTCCSSFLYVFMCICSSRFRFLQSQLLTKIFIMRKAIPSILMYQTTVTLRVNLRESSRQILFLLREIETRFPPFVFVGILFEATYTQKKKFIFSHCIGLYYSCVLLSICLSNSIFSENNNEKSVSLSSPDEEDFSGKSQ